MLMKLLVQKKVGSCWISSLSPHKLFQRSQKTAKALVSPTAQSMCRRCISGHPKKSWYKMEISRDPHRHMGISWKMSYLSESIYNNIIYIYKCLYKMFTHTVHLQPIYKLIDQCWVISPEVQTQTKTCSILFLHNRSILLPCLFLASSVQRSQFMAAFTTSWPADSLSPIHTHHDYFVASTLPLNLGTVLP